MTLGLELWLAQHEAQRASEPHMTAQRKAREMAKLWRRLAKESGLKVRRKRKA